MAWDNHGCDVGLYGIGDIMKINVDFIYPPIPVRSFDYQATFDGYEGGDVMGHGATPEEAIADLKANYEEKYDCEVL